MKTQKTEPSKDVDYYSAENSSTILHQSKKREARQPNLLFLSSDGDHRTLASPHINLPRSKDCGDPPQAVASLHPVGQENDGK
ncbi:hypothetical protein V6N13_135941 [Hibiscus sabdariffa]|uniref:Uncharacterized protein n=1 Tax=Hibiscus sabdariffa TaxID=183260 RepID=A0ABR2QTH5_9ROSI